MLVLMLVLNSYNCAIEDYGNPYGRVKVAFCCGTSSLMARCRGMDLMVTGSRSGTWYALTVRGRYFPYVNRAESYSETPFQLLLCQIVHKPRLPRGAIDAWTTPTVTHLTIASPC